MNQVTDEQLSAVLDGELPAGQLELLLARIDRDPAQRSRLARYAMIGECLRGGPASAGTLQIAERVRTTLLAEHASAAPPVGSTPPPWGSWIAGGLAAAAAIVAVLIAGPAMVWLDNQQSGGSAVVAAGEEESLPHITVPARYRLSPQAAARLTGYLVAHGEYANQLSRNNLDSHLVAARAERASWRQLQGPGDDR